MCTICASFNPFADDCVYSDAIAYAAYNETSDAAATISTAYTIAVGDTFSGNISSVGDQDWVRITVDAGASITFTQTASGVSPLGFESCFIQLYDAAGNLVAEEDDFGDNYSALTWTNAAGSAVTVYVALSEYGDNGTGTYTLSTEAVGSGTTEVYTHDQIADVLTTGYWGGGPYAWDVSPGDTITFNVNALTTAGKDLARLAFDAWEMVTGINFTEVTTGGDITLDDNQSGAFADFTFDGSNTITSATVNISTAWLSTYGTTIDSYSFQTYIHEIGHALGLGHAGNYNGNAIYGVDNDYLNDSWQATVMSYFDQVDNSYIDADFAYVLTPMIADIIAIQSLYGTATTLRTGNTVYGFNSTAGGYYDTLVSTSEPVTWTILDNGGTDTIDMSQDTFSEVVDLNDETVSSVLGLIGNLSIARGTMIEKFIAGSGDDTVTGNELANTIQGGDGRDLIRGLLGNDILSGGNGNDILHGGGGFDTLNGDYGKDRLFGGNGNDILNGGAIRDFLYGDEGNDTMDGGTGNDFLYGRAGDDLMYGGYGDDYLEGGAGRDTLYGDAGSDELYGGDAIDVLDGGVGDDRLDGGKGHDTLTGDIGLDTFVFSVVAFGNDVITDFVNDVDTIELAQVIWGGGLSIAQVIDTYASVVNGDTVFDFGTDKTITITGLFDKDLLIDDIVLV